MKKIGIFMTDLLQLLNDELLAIKIDFHTPYDL